MENMEIWNKLCKTPDKAKKEIKAGRLKGFTDIKPISRIEALTNTFGACGFGWYTKTIDEHPESYENGEVIVVTKIELYINVDGQWSMPIEGVGGNKVVSKESKGLYVSDEAYKMSYTDALGSACKNLGMCADVYWGDNDKTKYDHFGETSNNQVSNLVTQEESKSIYSLMLRKGLNIIDCLKKNYGIDNTDKLTKEQYKAILEKITPMPDKENK